MEVFESGCALLVSIAKPQIEDTVKQISSICGCHSDYVL